VGSGDDDVVGVDGSTAEVGAGSLQGHLVGMGIDAGLIATDDASIQLGQQALGNGACQGASQKGEEYRESQHFNRLYADPRIKTPYI